MCGIAGLIDPQRRIADPRKVLAGMAAALVHRGPDGGDAWHGDGAHLAHRRLAVIDTTDSAAQPMVGASGAVMVFNGEIYNHGELRDILAGHGRVFRTRSDSEVLLAAFEQWGEACLDRLVGMFAFAIWQPASRRLFLARDRLGKKPFYVHHDGRFVAFASELPALAGLEPVRTGAAIDLRALSDFLSLGYILTPKTILANVFRIPAGHAASFDADSGTWRQWSYWDLADHVTAPREPYDEAARRRFAELLDQSVAVRLGSDVPLGIFLSGGLDSSAVAATATRAGARPRAFCAGFHDSSFDERAFAHMAAGHLGLELEELLVDPATDGDLAQAVLQCGEPFADTSLLPTFRLNNVARRSVTVALTGDGADEILAGYPTHMADVLYRAYSRLPSLVQGGLEAAARRLFRPSYRKVSFDYRLRQFLAGRGLSPEQAHYWWRVVFSEPEKRRLLSPEVLDALNGYDPFDTFAGHFKAVKGANFLDRALYVDVKTWLQDDILVKADRMSMAWGLEVRSPFLDHRLVEFLARLEPKAKMAGRRQKVILRDAMVRALPEGILRRRKQGFGAPTREIIRLMPPTIDSTGLFRQEFRLDAQSEDVTYKGFALAVLDIWFNTFHRYQRDGSWPCRN